MSDDGPRTELGTPVTEDDRELATTVEACLLAIEAGETLDVEQIVATHARIASRLRMCLRNLVAIHAAADACSSWPVDHADTLPRFEDYEVLREIGRGGMGIVYEARQLSLDRTVALKVLPSAAVLDPRWLQRFRNEALATAQMNHPHIVPVYAVSREKGAHFFTMPLIDGQSLAAVIAEVRHYEAGRVDRRRSSNDHATRSNRSDNGPPSCRSTIEMALSPSFSEVSEHWPLRRTSSFYRAVAKLGLQAADALHYAHSLSIVHRDIKPSNVLIDIHGDAWITDFGLARLPAGKEVTLSGDLLGTLPYMSPEQAMGRHEMVDHRTDIYALGASLYELLTLRPLYDADDRHQVLDQIRLGGRTQPRKLNPYVPADLETIVLKAIDPCRDARYVTAKLMAEDLSRFLEQKPVLARRPGPWDRCKKWASRNPSYVWSSFVVSCVVVACTILILSRELHQSYERETMETLAREQAERSLYEQKIARADLEFVQSSVSHSESLLDECPETRRRWEWHLLKRRCRAERFNLSGHQASVSSVDFRSDGKMLATGDTEGAIRVWDVETQQTVRSISFPDVVYAIRFSPDGRCLAAAGGEWTQHRPAFVKVYDADSGVERFELSGHSETVSALAFHPAGQELATGGWDGRVLLWELDFGRQVGSLEGYPGSIKTVAFQPLTNRFVAAGTGGKIVIWDRVSGRKLRSIQEDSDVQDLSFSPDGRRCAVSLWSGVVRLYETQQWQVVNSVKWNDVQIADLQFSPQGQRLALATTRGSVHICDSQCGTLIMTVKGHDGWVSALDFSPSGNHLATVGRDRQVKIWEVRNSPQRPSLALAYGRTSRHGVSCDETGKMLALATWAHHGTEVPVVLYDTDSWQSIPTNCRRLNGFRAVALAPNGKTMLADWGNQICEWDVVADQQQRFLDGHTSALVSLKFSQRGDRFVSASEDGEVRIWPSHSASKPIVIAAHGDGVSTAIFDGTGDHVLTAGRDGKLYVWSAHDGSPQRMLTGHTGPIRDLAVHPTDALVATGGHDETIRIWRVDTGSQVIAWKCHTGAVNALCFSAGGDRLVSTGADGSIRCWDWESGQELARFGSSTNGEKSVANDPRGRWMIAAANQTNSMDVWDLSDWREPEPTRTIASWHQAEAEGLHALGQLGDACHHFECAVRLQPSDRKTWLQLGNVRQQLKQWSSACEAFDRAVQLADQATFDSGAVTVVDARLQRQFLHAAILARADAFEHLGDGNRACADYERACSLGPLPATVWAAWSRWRLLGPRELRDFDQAEMLLRHGFESDSHCGAVLENLALLELMHGHPKKAIELMRQSAEDPNRRPSPMVAWLFSPRDRFPHDIVRLFSRHTRVTLDGGKASRLEQIIRQVCQPGSWEGEWLVESSTVSSGSLIRQDMRPWSHQWSGHEQLFWCDATPGARALFRVHVRQRGNYRLHGNVTFAPDYGIFQLRHADHSIGVPVDAYAPEVTRSPPIDFGELTLNAGWNLLEVLIIDKNPSSTNYLFGLDRLDLIP